MTVELSWSEARSLSMRALGALGFSSDEAAIITDHLLDATARGQSKAGLPRILVIAERLRELGGAAHAPRAVRDTPVSQLIDAGGTLGYVAAHQAMQVAIDKARAAGVGLVGLRNSYATGNLSHYAEMAAAQDMAAIVCGNSLKSVAPHGAAEALLGTNPMAMGFPTTGDPIIWDAGASQIPHGELRLRRDLDELLPEGAAINAAGLPTQDAAEALAGALLPWGGHRGSGLAVAIQLLSMICDTDPVLETMQGWGFMAIVFRIDLFMDPQVYKARASELATRIREAAPAAGQTPRAPFEGSARRRRQNVSGPVILPDAVHAQILALADRPEDN